jgi:hypothetical protein
VPIADIELAAVLLGDLDHVGERLGRERRVRQEGDRHRGDQADRREVLARIEIGVGVQARIDRDRAGMGEHQRVAVGRGPDHRTRADQAGAAGAIVDDHLLADHAGKLLGHHPRQHIDAAAGRIGHHHGDGAGGIILRQGAAADGEHGAGNHRDERQPHHDLPFFRYPKKKKQPVPALVSGRVANSSTPVSPTELVDRDVRLQTGDLVLHLQLAALELDDGEVVDRRMLARFADLLLERLMPTA